MKKVFLYDAALSKFGIEAQRYMLFEECGELLDAISKFQRGRAEQEDVVTELADVTIMCEQMARYYGWGAYELHLAKKRKRLYRKVFKE